MYVATVCYYAEKHNKKKCIADADYNKLLVRIETEIDNIKKRVGGVKIDKIIYEYPSGKNFVKNF